MNEYIFRHFNYVALNEVDVHAKETVVDGIDKVPDGTITVNKSNKKVFDYTL